MVTRRKIRRIREIQRNIGINFDPFEVADLPDDLLVVNIRRRKARKEAEEIFIANQRFGV